MMEKQQREEHSKRHPDGELLVNRHMGESIQEKKAGNRDGDGRCIININRTYEIALLSFELQAAVETMAVHREGSSIQGTHATARTLEPKTCADHRKHLLRHAGLIIHRQRVTEEQASPVAGNGPVL
jgi:hypothetical protein